MRFFFIIICVFLSTQANAYHFCKGKINTVWVEGSGNVYIVGSWRRHHTKICDINNVWNNVQPEICKVWVSTAHLAYAAKSDVTVRYSDNAIENCSSIPIYGASPSPNYLMITEHPDT